jgi:hypothetical protein
MRKIRNVMFVVLVVVAVFASSRGVLADWDNWTYEGSYTWSWFGACFGWWSCEVNRHDECEDMCELYQREILNFDCYWNGGGAQYPDEPNCWASCECTEPG